MNKDEIRFGDGDLQKSTDPENWRFYYAARDNGALELYDTLKRCSTIPRCRENNDFYIHALFSAADDCNTCTRLRMALLLAMKVQSQYELDDSSETD